MSKLVNLRDDDGELVGKLNPETGRAQIGYAFYAAERTCEMVYDAEWSGDELYPTDCYACSVCGFKEMNGKPRFCPGCGARAIE